MNTAIERKLLDEQIAIAEAKSLAKMVEISDSEVVHQGGGVFLVRGKYHVDVRSPKPYIICACKSWALNNPTRLRQIGRTVRCKHVFKVQDMIDRGCFE